MKEERKEIERCKWEERRSNRGKIKKKKKKKKKKTTKKHTGFLQM